MSSAVGLQGWIGKRVAVRIPPGWTVTGVLREVTDEGIRLSGATYGGGTEAPGDFRVAHAMCLVVALLGEVEECQVW